MSRPQPDETILACNPVRDGASVLRVSLDEDGWHMLCDADHSTGAEACASLHFALLVERDPTLAGIPSIPVGGSARRTSKSAPWLVGPHDHSDAAERERENVMYAAIEKYGYHVWSVAGGDEPDFSYTVGVTQTHGHPELIVFGQQEAWRRHLLNAIVDRIVDGETYEERSTIAGIIPPDYDVEFRAIESLESYVEYVGYAVWYYREIGRTEPFSILQAFWQDKGHRYPWEAGYQGYAQPAVP